MKNQLLTIILLFITNFCYSQISIGKIEHTKISENEVKIPPYDSLENFTDYGDYYKNGVPEYERCAKSEFYKRYVGLQIYYPMFSDNYQTDGTIIFKNEGSIKLLNWSDIGERYFSIQDIQYPFEKSAFFEGIKALKHEIPLFMTDALVFELKDNSSNERIYVVEQSYSVKFILTPYYTKANQFFDENDFIAIKDYTANKVPLGGGFVPVEKGSRWKGKLTLLRIKDLQEDDYDGADAEDIKYKVVLSNDSNKIIVSLYCDDDYNCLRNFFTTQEIFKEQNQQEQNAAKIRLDQLMKRYGDQYGKEIYEGRVSLGMTKEMCEEAWGTTLNRRSYTNSSVKIELWKYVGFGKLYFTNGKLSDIVRY